MAKEGLHKGVYHHGDPTYEAVVAKFRKEAREAAARNRAMTAFRVFAAVRLIVKLAGYRLRGEIIIEDERRGAVYRYGKEEK